MANRLNFVADSVKSKPKHVDSSISYLGFDALLPVEVNALRMDLRETLEKEKIGEMMIPHVEKATFPYDVVEKLKPLVLLKHFFKKPYGVGTSCIKQGALVLELARVDASLATFFIVQAGLLGFTVETLGSEEQKKKYLPKIINLDLIGGWALTEEKVGSDASNVLATSTKTEKGYKLNGIKRWMGNANRDLLVVFAKNEQKKVEAYLLETSNNPKGFKSQVIRNKIGMRAIENCNVELTDFEVGEENKLPAAKDFQSGANVVLKHSRPIVCWIAVGICVGIYDNAIKYTTQRHQFGRPVAGFQLVQEKLVKMMSTIQAMLFLAWRIATLYDEGNIDIAQIAMSKAWITDKARDVARWGREVCGGNGLLHENYVMRALTDIEGVYTYEGTYEVNTLVTGRHLTGLSAFTK